MRNAAPKRLAEIGIAIGARQRAKKASKPLASQANPLLANANDRYGRRLHDASALRGRRMATMVLSVPPD